MKLRLSWNTLDVLFMVESPRFSNIDQPITGVADTAGSAAWFLFALVGCWVGSSVFRNQRGGDIALLMITP